MQRWNRHQILNSFGDLITQIDLFFNYDNTVIVCSDSVDVWRRGNPAMLDYMIKCFIGSKYEHLIVDYLNDYCCDFLTNIKFQNFPKSGFNQLTKTFKKVEKLVMWSSDATEPKKRLYDLFPSVRELELFECNIHNEFIANHFPYLEHLEIHTKLPTEISIESVATTLRLNPQLKNLTGDIWWNIIFNTDEFKNRSEIFQNLERLELEPDSLGSSGLNIHFEKLSELVIHCNCIPSDIELDLTIPFSCNKLESLSIFWDWNDESVFFNIINNYPTVKNFTFDCNCIINHLKISEVLPLLEVIDFDEYLGFFFTIDEIIHFIQKFQFLKVFRVHTDREGLSLENLRRRLGNGWSISTELKKWSITIKLKITKNVK